MQPDVSAPATGSEKTASPVDASPPDAADCVSVLYVPGMFEIVDGQCPDGFAQRLARALDHQAREVSARFEVRPAANLAYAHGALEAQVREVVRVAPGAGPEVTHRLFVLDYQPELEAARKESNLFTQIAALGGALWVMGWRYLMHGLRARSLGFNQKLTLVLSGAFLVVLVAYFLLLVTQAAAAMGISLWAWAGGVVDGFSEIIWSITGPWTLLDCPAQWVVEKGRGWAEWRGEIEGGLTIMGLGALTWKRVRDGLARGVTLFLLTTRYFLAGLGRAACTGRFHDLLEAVAERHAGRIDVVAYSMGSLVAMDALFPFKGAPEGRVDRVNALTTIGCPFDLVRTFWPGYFDGRVVARGAPRWVNVFSPVDVLGSNFVNKPYVVRVPVRGINADDAMTPMDAEAQKVAVPPTPAPERAAEADARVLLPEANLAYDHLGRDRLGWTDVILLHGLTAHSQYWVRDKPRADSCLGQLVARLYG